MSHIRANFVIKSRAPTDSLETLEYFVLLALIASFGDLLVDCWRLAESHNPLVRRASVQTRGW